MTLTAAETCRRVADIIDFEPDRFYVGQWEMQDSCGTTACIAGHTALLHNDGIAENKKLVFKFDDETSLSPDSEWIVRQGQRLGLTEKAADVMFDPGLYLWRRYNPDRRNHRYSRVLRQLEKELEDRDSDDLIDVDELEQIAEEALW